MTGRFRSVCDAFGIALSRNRRVRRSEPKRCCCADRNPPDRNADAQRSAIPDRRQERQACVNRRRAEYSAGRHGRKIPAVVLLHGSGGVNGGNELWAKHFNEMGIAAYLLDSFTGARPHQYVDQPGAARAAQYGARCLSGLDMLAEHPRIDPTRVAVMGFSRGGQSALYSSMRRFQQLWTPKAQFAAHIPLYASCTPTFIDDTDVTAPIRQHHGQADDYVTVGPCRPYFERLRAAGRDAVLTEYPDAHHSYDNPLGPKVPTVSKGSQSTRACTLKEESPGRRGCRDRRAFHLQRPLRRDRSAPRLQRGGDHCHPDGGEGASAHDLQARVTGDTLRQAEGRPSGRPLAFECLIKRAGTIANVRPHGAPAVKSPPPWCRP